MWNVARERLHDEKSRGVIHSEDIHDQRINWGGRSPDQWLVERILLCNIWQLVSFASIKLRRIMQLERVT